MRQSNRNGRKIRCENENKNQKPKMNFKLKPFAGLKFIYSCLNLEPRTVYCIVILCYAIAMTCPMTPFKIDIRSPILIDFTNYLTFFFLKKSQITLSIGKGVRQHPMKQCSII